MNQSKKAPGNVRDAIISVLANEARGLRVRSIEERVAAQIGATPPSSVRSYLRLNTPAVFVREERGMYRLRQELLPEIEHVPHQLNSEKPYFSWKNARLYHEDCLQWLGKQAENQFHAVVTDPPYGLQEYYPEQQEKMRAGKGGVWRLPPAFDGHTRSPLPRFTTLNEAQIQELSSFFYKWGRLLLPKLRPGANVLVATNPLLSFVVANALSDSGLERRGEVVRLVMTMRGGDRPKAAHEEFSEVSVMPRSMWEPWLVYRKPLEGRVQDNLRKWQTGGFRRPTKDKPFGDVIPSSPTRKNEREMAPHPSLKPQAFMRQLVRAVLPLGEGVVLDPFAGAGSTLAAAQAVGYESIGVEKDQHYFDIACQALPRLSELRIRQES